MCEASFIDDTSVNGSEEDGLKSIYYFLDFAFPLVFYFMN